MPTPDEIRTDILAAAQEIGFDDIAITAPVLGGAGEKLDEFIALGRHGDMAWMPEKAHRRSDPLTLWPEARSVIMVAHNYGPDTDPTAIHAKKGRGAISVYAQGKDYHDVLKKRLKRLARHVHQTQDCAVKVFVDTAPVMEKPLAAMAGLGWQGKHTNLVSRTYGSWLFLGALFTTLDLPPDTPHDDRCGTCHACLDACPTQAFPAPYQLDARRCISYLTIEHKGHIEREFRSKMGNRIYGCDDCLAACPWNRFAQTAREAAYHAREYLKSPTLAEILTLDDERFRAFFTGSPIKRTGRDRFLRNALIAAGNSNDPTLLAPVISLLDDASPLVRAMAVWALGQLADADQRASVQSSYQDREHDADVLSEWDQLSG